MPKVRGNGNIITASFDGRSKSLFPSIKDTKDLILLSIQGNEFCTGEYLGAMIQQAVATHQNRAGGSVAQGKTTFLIADEIYWHNLKDMKPSFDATTAFKKQAKALGDAYFINNLSYFLAPFGITSDYFNHQYSDKSVDEKIEIINQLATDKKKNFEIIRWRTWIDQSHSQDKINAMIPLYESVEGLKVAVDQTSNDFANRHSKNGEDFRLWNHRARGYLAEESAAVMWLAAFLGYNFVIYPGAILPIFSATKEFFVIKKHFPRISQGESIKENCTHSEFSLHVADPSRLVNWLEVNFKKNKSSEISTAKDLGLTFFSSPNDQPIKNIKEHVDKKIELGVKERSRGEIVPQKDTIILSIVDGVAKGLADDPHFRKKPQLLCSTKLTDIFEGITRGILKTDLPSSEKIGFLTKLVDVYVANNPESPQACLTTYAK